MLHRDALYPLILTLGLGVGCSSNGGWCGYNQPAYPIGSYPYNGYPGVVPPGGSYPPPGAFGASNTANLPTTGPIPGATGAPATGVPQYSAPLPSGYPPMGAYPGAMQPYQGGVPLNQFNPNQPFIGR